MWQLAAELRDVESNRRALAKSSCVKWIDGDEKSSRRVLRALLSTHPAKRHRLGGQGRRYQQAGAERDAPPGYGRVLNFLPGNEPTSLRYVAHGHKRLGVSEAELVQCKDGFLELLEKRLDRRIPRSGPMAGRKQEIYNAWTELFDQVVDYFRKEGSATESAAPLDETRGRHAAVHHDCGRAGPRRAASSC